MKYEVCAHYMVSIQCLHNVFLSQKSVDTLALKYYISNTTAVTLLKPTYPSAGDLSNNGMIWGLLATEEILLGHKFLFNLAQCIVCLLYTSRCV